MATKNPMYLSKVVLKNGGVIETEVGTDIIAVSAGGTPSITGSVTVTGATTTFNVGTNQTFTKEVNHTLSVSATTTDATVGGNLAIAAGAGVTTGTGGSMSVTGGAGGNDAVGGAASLVGGAAGGGNRAGGAAVVTGGAGAGSGVGGAATVTGGLAGATNAAGGVASLVGGAGQGTGDGAVSKIVGGASGSGATGAGGAAQVTGGAAASTNGDGGSVVLTGGAKAGTGIAGVIFNKSLQVLKQGAPTAKTTSATLTAAEVLAGIITVNQGAAGASALQMPTGTQLAAALPAAFTTNDAFDFYVINTSTVDAEDASITVNTDVTIVGNADIPAYSAAGSLNSSAHFRARMTAANTFVVYRLA